MAPIASWGPGSDAFDPFSIAVLEHIMHQAHVRIPLSIMACLNLPSRVRNLPTYPHNEPSAPNRTTCYASEATEDT